MGALSTSLPLPQMQTKWAATLNPVVANPLNSVTILTDVVLVTGVNVINHTLGAIQQGWFLVDLQAPVTVYRSSPFNGSTLTLTSSGAATVSIGVF